MISNRHIVTLFSFVLAVVLSTSCSKQTVVNSKPGATDLAKYQGGFELSKDENGVTRSTSTKVSHYDSYRNKASKGSSIRKTDYSKDSYRKQRWGGDSTFGKKSYNGLNDYKAGTYKASDNTSFDKNFTAGGSNYQGQSFATSNNTSERNAGYIKTGSSGYVRSKENATPPRIISRDEYNKLGVKDSNNLLGR